MAMCRAGSAAQKKKNKTAAAPLFAMLAPESAGVLVGSWVLLLGRQLALVALTGPEQARVSGVLGAAAVG